MSKISNFFPFTLSPLQSIPIPLPTLMQSNSTHFQNTHTNRQSPSSFLQSIPHFPQTIYAPTPIQTHTLLFTQHKTTNQHYHRLYTFFRLSTQNCSICPFCHHFPNTSNALTHSLIYTWTIMRSMHSLPYSAFIQMHFNLAPIIIDFNIYFIFFHNLCHSIPLILLYATTAISLELETCDAKRWCAITATIFIFWPFSILFKQ